MKNDKLIYWAGFFDGQGHVELAYTNPTHANPRGKYAFQVWINQWSKAPNEFFGELTANFGGRVIPSDKSSRPYNARWYASGTSARSFLESILSYLRKRKREAELGVDLQRRMAKNRGKPLTESEIKARDAILEEYFSLILGNNPSRRMRKLGSDVRRSFENIGRR